MERIQIIAITASLFFLLYIGRLIIKRRLREEYSIVWIVCTAFLLIFSFWRGGLTILAKIFGVIEPPNLIFTGAIFAIMIYLLHISIVISKLQSNNKKLAQEIALLKNKVEKGTGAVYDKAFKRAYPTTAVEAENQKQ